MFPGAVLALAWCVTALAAAPGAPRALSAKDNIAWTGNHLFIAVTGFSLSPESRSVLREVRPFGVVLMGDNIRDKAQTTALVKQIKEAAGCGGGLADLPLIAVDQEGGRVNRLELSDAPSAADIGVTANPEKARENGRRYARECRERRIGIVLAPVLDISEEGASTVIDDRAFGNEPGIVTKMGLAFAVGVMEEGVLPVAKHFPGHGSTKQDSHDRLAVLARKDERLREILFPFEQAVEAGVPVVMVGHIAVPALDPGNPRRPASQSPAIVKGVLRDAWHYDGVVITDDIHMAGAGSSTPASAVRALASGVDAVMICQSDPSLIQATCRTMEDSLRAGQLDRRELERSEVRLTRLQEWLRVSAFLAQGRQRISAKSPYLANLPESLMGAPPVVRKAAAPDVPAVSVQAPRAESEETKSAAEHRLEAKPENVVKVEKLDIPGPAPKQPVAAVAPKTEDQKKIEERPDESTPVGDIKKQTPVQPEKPPGDSKEYKEYKVYGVKGKDTLSSIGRELDVPVSVLRKLNPDIDPDYIKEGQKITYPAKQNVSARAKRSD